MTKLEQKQKIMEAVETITNTCWSNLSTAKRRMEHLEGDTPELTPFLCELLQKMYRIAGLAEERTERIGWQIEKEWDKHQPKSQGDV